MKLVHEYVYVNGLGKTIQVFERYPGEEYPFEDKEFLRYTADGKYIDWGESDTEVHPVDVLSLVERSKTHTCCACGEVIPCSSHACFSCQAAWELLDAQQLGCSVDFSALSDIGLCTFIPAPELKRDDQHISALIKELQTRLAETMYKLSCTRQSTLNSEEWDLLRKKIKN